MSFSSPEKLPFIQLAPPFQSLLLATMLLEHNVATDFWGEGTSKTLEHLVTEINSGESTLIINEQGELIRQVQVVHINVFHREGTVVYQLVETSQVFTNGRVRLRGLMGISEKIKRGEQYINAAYRALYEELGINTCSDIYYLGNSPNSHRLTSYPGLITNSEVHQCHVWLAGEDYKPDGYVEVQTDKKTYFSWKVLATLTE